MRRLFSEALEIGTVLALVLIMWKSSMIISTASIPAVVVVSGSMEPGIRRGDMLLLETVEGDIPVRTGQIVVFKLVNRDVPIVHRVIKVHEHRSTGEIEVLTKGDANLEDDQFLYGTDRQWIQRKELLGRVVWLVPYVGHITLLATEHKLVKYTMSVIMCFLMLVARFRRN